MAFLLSEERSKVPFFKIASTFGKAIFSKGAGKVGRLLTVALTIALLGAILATVYIIAVPKEEERFTEFYILGQNKTATDYPGQIIAGQNYPMYIGVGNHEYRDMTYTIETWMVNTEFDNVTNTSRIIAMDPYDHLSFTLTDNTSTILPYNLSVKKAGYDRVEFLLFNDSVPGLDITGRDRINASYRDLHLWVTVGEEGVAEEGDRYEESSG
jgi:uncharacterized membrane protein